MYTHAGADTTVGYLVRNYGLPKNISKKIIKSGSGFHFDKSCSSIDMSMIIYKTGSVESFMDEKQLIKTMLGREVTILEETVDDIQYFIFDKDLYDRYSVDIKYLGEVAQNQTTYDNSIIFDDDQVASFKSQVELNRAVAGIDDMPSYLQTVDDINIIICQGKSYLHYDINLVFYQRGHKE